MTHHFILVFQTGFLQVLSQQMLIDCSWGFGNNACDGGEEWRAYEWIMKHGGIAPTETYGPYMGMVRSPHTCQIGYCSVATHKIEEFLQSCCTNLRQGFVAFLSERGLN